MPGPTANPTSAKKQYEPTSTSAAQKGPGGSGQSGSSAPYYDGDSIPFLELYQDVVGTFKTQPNLGTIKRELNKVIHQINDEIGLFDAMVTVTIGTETNAMSSITTYFESVSTNIEKIGRFALEWSFDSVSKSLKLPNYVSEFKQVYIDDEEWEYVPFDVVKDSENSSEKIWHQTGRFIYFPIDLSTETKILKVRVKMMYPGIRDFAGYSLLESQIYLPHNYRMLLVSGVIMNLSVIQEYKDSDIYNHYKELYANEYTALIRKGDNIQSTYENFSFKYTY